MTASRRTRILVTNVNPTAITSDRSEAASACCTFHEQMASTMSRQIDRARNDGERDLLL